MFLPILGGVRESMAGSRHASKDATVVSKRNDDDDENMRREREDIACQSLEKAIRELHHDYFLEHKDRLRRLIRKSIVFRNNKAGNSGKPHDVETRIALTLYHQWKREVLTRNESKDNAKDNHSCKSQSSTPVVAITSDLGLTREVTSPRQLADLICPMLEEEFRNHPHWDMAPDVRSQSSGIMSMISSERSKLLRRAGRLPCPHCIQWCKGEKGLWWHQQQYHAIEHSDAAATAQATSNSTGAIVLYDARNRNPHSNEDDGSIPTLPSETIIENNNTRDDPMESIRNGNLEDLRAAVENRGFQPSTFFDNRGATPLMWAAGGGHLEIARYLIEVCNCDPTQPQKGKRSFAGRTALHWAARNGHLEVVRYLLGLATTTSSTNNTNSSETLSLHKLLEAKTQDGTTAFGWACWQRHIPIMKCLYQHGCKIHGLNSFGCSPVLWCSQGTNEKGLPALQWLREKGCCMTLVNHNGHGVLHKAAQRGQMDVAKWLIHEECGLLLGMSLSNTTNTNVGGENNNTEHSNNTLLAMVGPDIEGYCPSDLAGMEGHDDFANWLATIEIRICRKLGSAPVYEIPNGFSSDGVNANETACRVWEKYGGLRRMRSAVKEQNERR